MADLATRVRALTVRAETHYTVRQVAYACASRVADTRSPKPAGLRWYHVPVRAARTIAALLTLRDHLIARSSRAPDGPGAVEDPYGVNRDYETLRDARRTLFHDLALDTTA